MAKSKSASRKSAAKKASKTGKSRAAAKKASKTPRRAAGTKAAATHKRRGAAKKAFRPRKTKAATGAMGKNPAVAEIDNRIAIIRDNLRQLVEQAASNSGAANEELMSQRIADQEAKLALLIKQREEISLRG